MDFTIQGTVRATDGTPIAGASVTVVARALRAADAQLGTGTTAADGTYSVSFTADNVDIVVTATLGGLSASSPLIVGPSSNEQVDLVVGGAYLGPSDYTSVVAAISPLISAQTATIADFTEAEIALLATKAGVTPGDLVLLRQAQALAAQTSLPDTLFYALGRQHVPLSFRSIVTTVPQVRRDAVNAAIAANQIPLLPASQLDTAHAALDQLAVNEALRTAGAGETTLGALLGAAGITPSLGATLVAQHVAVGGNPTAFWAAVHAAHPITETQIATLQNTLQINALVFNHVPLVTALLGQGHTTPASLASLEKTDWQALVATAGVPPDLAAAGITAAEYVDQIAAAVEDALPTARVAARASHLPPTTNLTQFLSSNPSFDVRATPVTAFLRANTGALSFLSTDAARATFTQQLAGIQRVYRLAPDGSRLQVMETLLAAGVDSAQAIRRMGQTAFLRQFSATLGADLAEKTYARASAAAAVVTTLIAKHGAAFAGPPMRALPTRPDTVTQIPDWATLFGATESCACSDCQSLLSPSAYLVDTLHWLDRPGTASGTATALDQLELRRADLGTIELSCANANTELPQIDLAIELLELAVAPSSTTPYQTTGAAEDLRVQPEHQNKPAYTVLAGADPSKGAVYPFSLPYDLGLDEARTYMGALGVARSDVMDVFHAGGRDAALTDPVVAAEVLGMSPLEWAIIAGNALTPPRSTTDFWGGATLAQLTTVSSFLAHAFPGAGAAAAQTPAPQVTQDAAKGVYVPATAVEWSNLGLPAPALQHGFQDAASPISAQIGSVTLAATSTIAFQDTVSGWTRKGIGLHDGATESCSSSSSSLPDPATVSHLWLLYWDAPTSHPTSARAVAQIGSASGAKMAVQVDATGKLLVYCGANNAHGTVDVTTGRRGYLVLQHDVTHSSAVVYTPDEKVVVTYGALSGKDLALGGTALAQHFLFGALFTGADAEKLAADVKAMMTTLGFSSSWS